MNINQFWNVIQPIKNSKVPAKSLKNVLSKLPPEEIISFKIHFEKTYLFSERFNLFQAAFLKNKFSDEELFAAFRAGLISKGRKIFETVLKNPDSLIDYRIDNDDCFAYVPMVVYQDITGRSMPQDYFNVSGEYEFEDGCKIDDSPEWDVWNEKENRKFLPKLSSNYFAEGSVNIHTRGVAVFTNATYTENLSKRIYNVYEVSHTK